MPRADQLRSAQQCDAVCRQLSLLRDQSFIIQGVLFASIARETFSRCPARSARHLQGDVPDSIEIDPECPDHLLLQRLLSYVTTAPKGPARAAVAQRAASQRVGAGGESMPPPPPRPVSAKGAQRPHMRTHRVAAVS